jgi:hypothetical protein
MMQINWNAVAAQLLALVAEFDTRFAGLDMDATKRKIDAWAPVLASAGVPPEYLAKAVQVVYGTGDRGPLNPLGAVLDEARNARNRASQGMVVRELTATPRNTGGPSKSVYEATGTLGVGCPRCGARPGLPCVGAYGPTRAPHLERYKLAHPENGGFKPSKSPHPHKPPRGAKKSATRQAGADSGPFNDEERSRQWQQLLKARELPH